MGSISRKRNLGMKMRCRSAIKRIGPFIDGELSERETLALREHLGACGDCSRRYARMSGLVEELASLPAIVPTPEESYRLMNRLRREMAAPPAPATISRRSQLAAAALSALVLVTVAGVSLAIWNGGGPTPVTEESAEDGYREAGTGVSGGQEAELHAGQTAVTVPAAPVRPSLVISDKDYTAADLEDFRNDLGTRLDFYSAYWYPSSGEIARAATLKQLQADLTEDLAAQAAAKGHDPADLEQAVAAAISQTAGEPVIPCYAERARMDGKEVWLISASGPEDYLLFPDPQKPPAMILASLSGSEGLKVSESLLREMAARLAPYGNGSAGLAPTGAAATREETAKEGGTAAEGQQATETAPEETSAEEDFQSFLRRLAAQGTSLDIITALKGLDHEQIALLLQGNWAALAEDGVNLGDFITPPKRMWAVACGSSEVLWAAQ